MAEQHFVVGQRISCMDGNNQKWYYARIKDVKSDKVLVQWSNPKWQSSKYDQWIIKAHYEIRIRPRNHNNTSDNRSLGTRIAGSFSTVSNHPNVQYAVQNYNQMNQNYNQNN
eukprot:1003771_1